MQALRLFSLALVLAAWLGACGSDDKRMKVTTTDHVACEGNAITCKDGVATRCVDGEEEEQSCDETNDLCVPDKGCRLCAPGSGQCDGETTQRCSEDGKRWIDGEVCSGEGGVHCQASLGVCVNLCGAAAESRSYVGCEYWPVSAANLVSKSFDYAVIVSNPQSVPAEVRIHADKSATTAAFDDSATIKPGKLKKFLLPWRKTGEEGAPGVSDTAYRLSSSVPVSAYQFNPLQYRLDMDCATDDYDPDPADGVCFSYTNDASLLLPTAALDTSYMVVAPITSSANQSINGADGDPLGDDAGTPVQAVYSQPASATIVATQDTTVTVMPTAAVLCSEGRFAAGEKITLKLARGEASQLFFDPPESISDCPGRYDEQSVELPCNDDPSGTCVVRREYCEGADPTGTRITSSAPIAVYVGSPCTFVPYNRRACDHLEEALPPLRTWGKEVVVAITKPIGNEPNIVRIVSASDGNTLTFQPKSAHAKITLNAGQTVEIQARESFKVKGTQPLLASQYLVGQDDVGLEALLDASVVVRDSGDPSLSFAAPVEQYRRDFDFLTPDTYDSSFITVVTPSGSSVAVDDDYITHFEEIGNTGYSVGHHELAPGTHHVRGSLPIAVQVYGFGAYTSYMFPAGLNLDQVNDVF